jgi:hypothetical protein
MRGLRDNILVWLSTTGVDNSAQLSSPCQSSKMGKTPVRVGTLAFGFCVHSCILQQKHIPGQQNFYTIEHNPQRLKGKSSKGRILGRHWFKSPKSFPPCYSLSPLLTDFTPSLEQKWFETGLYCRHCIRKPQV